MPYIKPFSRVDEHDVINLFTYTGAFPVNRGTFVKCAGSGFMPSVDIDMLGSVGASYVNTVSQRYTTVHKVGPVNNSGDKTIGMLLYDGKELDENGEKLIFNPRKAAEMECFVSGQTAPIVRQGMFLYSGLQGEGLKPGDYLYLGSNGGLNVSGGANQTATPVGQALGGITADGFFLFQLDI